MSLRRCSKYATSAALALFCCLGNALAAETQDDSHFLPADPNYDLVSAQIPYDEAQIASVALARLNIMLYKAKANAEMTLCNGNWTPRGKAVKHIGPRPVLTPSIGRKSWHYRSLRQAHSLACPRVSRAEFFLEMSRHLPAWVVIRPAGQLTAFRQGAVYPASPSSVASR